MHHAPEGVFSPIVELRQYTLHPGQRDVLIELFESELIEPQEAVGMTVLGQFRDLDDDDRFVWLRGFGDMDERARSLGAFYDGPVWREHRDAANATMIDSSDVLLLRPARPEAGFSLANDSHHHRAAATRGSGLMALTFTLEPLVKSSDAINAFEREIVPKLAARAVILGYFVTESAPNTFPRLPVRENMNVLVVFVGDLPAAPSGDWTPFSDLSAAGLGKCAVLRLEPTTASRLNGRTPPCQATSRKI